jgi:hypothetical protein
VAGGCTEERDDVVRKTIGSAGGLVSSHDDVLTLVFQPGALTREHEIVIFPSDEPPLVFGPAYRVKPDIALAVDVEVTYRRVLPNDADGVAVAAIRLDDYAAEMGHWVPLPRLSIDVESGAVLAHDTELSLYYGMLEFGGSASSAGTSGPTDGSASSEDPTTEPTAGVTSDPTGEPVTGSTTDPTDPTNATDPTGESCGNGSVDPGELCFETFDVPMGGGPVDVVLGDLDGDGRLDVATANADGTYGVRLGDGAGGLGAEQGGAAGMGPVAIGAGDFDGMMGDDLVVIAAGQMSLLQSQGDGTFVLNPVALAGTAPSEVLVADVDDDGGPDIIVANQGSGTVTYFSFMGGLGPPIDYGTGMVSAPAGLSWGQYNLDTDMFEDVFAFGGGSYAALPGDGVALAPAPVGGALGTDLRRAVGGDLGGGAPGDAAVADFAEGGVYVLLGNGAPNGFAAMDFYATGAGALDVAAADLTGDGDLDLVVANGLDDTVTVLEKTGASTWGNPTDFDVVAGPSGVGVGDLDGDDAPDVVVCGEAGNAVTILLSDP